MYIVEFLDSKTRKRTNVYGPFRSRGDAHRFARNNRECDETFEIIYMNVVHQGFAK